ncbi:MAG TPA: uroporphyrinogen-III C-methyltransferase [Noviherbaspirillum sp.]|uniref:uroporphyrinogen-III C-methyltransferase n=1 Tax=Noviherbaspirillum sp. TaxID=1926288 RepID=UPI002D62D596|nr:uroporphyrinogen-III C-methyltransferase [Noviherbaspirillum sp.]HYD96339.1 uroporphyrinogen-III C-methyltransferase [Noviherbaspirillum sp.]
MNELPSSSDAHQPAQPGQTPAQAPAAAAFQNDNPARLRQMNRVMLAGLGVLALLLGAQWWNSEREIGQLREEMAQRLRSGETVTTETKVMVKSVQDAMKEMQAKVNVLENKQVEAQSQQLALEHLYQELSRNRDDWALAEIEQVLSTASQQLQLAGNVQGAVIALQNADNRLSRSDKPQFIIIRRAIAADLERLKALPVVDLTGIALRLDSIIGQVDSMPLLADEKPAVAANQPRAPRRAARNAEARPAEGKASASGDWLGNLEELWHSWTSEMWGEIRQLVRVRNVEVSDALLLSPTQAYYARENLKLRLLNARLALLTRNESAFRSDLVAAQDAIAKYFDTRAKQTQTTQALLRQVQASNLSIEMPTLAESLNAVRNYKAKP